jgi:hypothetical protein
LTGWRMGSARKMGMLSSSGGLGNVGLFIAGGADVDAASCPVSFPRHQPAG